MSAHAKAGYPAWFQLSHLLLRDTIVATMGSLLVVRLIPQLPAGSYVGIYLTWLYAATAVFPVYLLLEHLVMKGLVRRGRASVAPEALREQLGTDGRFVLVYVLFVVLLPLIVLLLS